MIVADSSYIVEGLLADRSSLMHDKVLAPDLAVYEAVGAVWKHEVLLRKIREGEKFLGALADLVETGGVLTVEPDERLLMRAYAVAVRHRIHPHDAVYIALALENGLDLKTYDEVQRRAYEAEVSGVGEGRRHSRRTAGDR